MHYVKDLPDSGPSGRTRRAVQVSRIVSGVRQPWDMDDAEFTKGGYYYPMTNNEYPRVFSSIGPLMQASFGQDYLILVPKTLWKKFEGASQWKLFEPALNALVKMEAQKVCNHFGNKYKWHPAINLMVFADVEGPVGDFAKKVRDEVAPDRYLGLTGAVWVDLLKSCGLPVPNNEKTQAEYKKLIDEYPLLELYGGHQPKKIVDAFKSYLAAKE